MKHLLLRISTIAVLVFCGGVLAQETVKITTESEFKPIRTVLTDRVPYHSEAESLSRAAMCVEGHGAIYEHESSACGSAGRRKLGDPAGRGSDRRMSWHRLQSVVGSIEM